MMSDDFYSTNELTHVQFTLAMQRRIEKLEASNKGLHDTLNRMVEISQLQANKLDENREEINILTKIAGELFSFNKAVMNRFEAHEIAMDSIENRIK